MYKENPKKCKIRIKVINNIVRLIYDNPTQLPMWASVYSLHLSSGLFTKLSTRWSIIGLFTTTRQVSPVEQPGQGRKIGDWINHDEEHDDIVTRSTATAQKA